ncbi:MAG: flagellar hook-associated protein FlgK [Vampirovibrionales bacterium]|nr:flagellar hook-associated protein FlgK [Vampirovibrionales bacterium]
MITPAFFGFYTSHRALLATQMALNTVNHNISNSNTPGYSRQRLNLEAFDAYASPVQLGQDLRSGQVGQGVQVVDIKRIRDAFIDIQYRAESGIQGYNASFRDALQQLEGIAAEPSKSAINGSIQKFFDAAQELSINPQSQAVRADFIQHAVDILTVFQQEANQLATLQRNMVGDPAVPGSFTTSQLAINVTEVNNKLAELARYNQEILTVKASGASPNDLLDKRDNTLDALSKLVDITTQETSNGQMAVSIAGQLMVRGGTVLDTLQVVANAGPIPDPENEPSLVRTAVSGVDILNAPVNAVQYGGIKGIVDAAGRSATQSTVRGMLEDIDNLLDTLASQVNALQTTGRDLNGNVQAGEPLFNLTAGAGLNIFRYRVNPNIIQDPSLVAAAEGPPNPFLGAGDGSNALAMAQLRDGAYAALGNTSFVEFYNGVVSSLGIDARTFENRNDSQDSVVKALDQRRQSVSGVNESEELSDLIRFQRAFEASSKTMQVFNEVTQTILNMVN